MAFNLRIKITSTDVEVKSGTNARGPWEIREQEAYMFKSGDEFPEKIIIALGKEAPAYEPGMYELDEKSIYVGKFKQPQLSMRLRPVAAAAQQQKAS
ncbi:hypothetical protein BVH03_09460 [Pseudomonas sp. PA15(2017)]|uniref:single-stranded DNA-binding protein n=1 Tax=Pseudomonas sp. PA15(2017) TaxID=1932111 RepID=UPI000963CCE0|nr:single-stranded DNA-binding protein [Pseudomonas sp. PA15(2017)]OLU30707.1 hypothetical protein BVH03_09460 [Pseudomonas sp. PA15(2017)]